MSDTHQMRIYVASLSDYNAGNYHGKWIDVIGKDVEEIQAEVNAMLATSTEEPHEEWAIHDFEGFGKWRLGEWESFAKISLVGQIVDDLLTTDEDRIAPFLYWFYRVDMEGRYDAADFYDNPDGLHEHFREEYRGDFNSFQDFIEETDEGEMFLGLPHLQQVVEEYDEANRYTAGSRDATQQMLQNLQNFIDWSRVAHEMELVGNYDVEQHESGTWVFEDRNH